MRFHRNRALHGKQCHECGQRIAWTAGDQRWGSRDGFVHRPERPPPFGTSF
ncbi:MAG: zinc-ribbon domain containing protein [Verrucomicrobia bacterium]|nr:zinc-ribbon domain containing protein [Verrucomicrobiota bacterium]